MTDREHALNADIAELDEELELIDGSLNHNVEPNNLIANFWRGVDSIIDRYNIQDVDAFHDYMMMTKEERLASGLKF